MFDRLGNTLARLWPAILMIWIAGLGIAAWRAPPLDDVVQTGEFAFLPADSPSRKAEDLFAEAFASDQAASRVVIVARHLAGEGLTNADLEFIDDDVDGGDTDRKFELVERLRDIAHSQEGSHPKAAAESDEETEDDDDLDTGEFGPKSNIHRIRTFRDKTFGRLLLSDDKKATLIYVELRHEFMDAANIPTVEAIEHLIHDDEFRRKIPPGLDLSLSGEAVVGRDMIAAAKNSAKATEHLTVVLVVVLLMLIYRAPLLALIPLATVFVSVKLTMLLLQIGAEFDWIVLFQGIESYVTVLLYGAGVDYCLFLIARYKEELDDGKTYREAVIGAVSKVGAAIAASAGTVICGIGMMTFAEFGKFHEAGIAIAFGLVIVLLAALTFTPSLLLLMGRWVFAWQLRMRKKPPATGWLPAPSLASRLGEMSLIRDLWEHVGQALLKNPMSIWLGTIALMIPFAIVGVWNYTDLSYGLLSDLSPQAPSVVGTKAVQNHFPAGAVGTIVLLIEDPAVDFARRSDENGKDGGLELIRKLTKSLDAKSKELRLADVRSVSHPFGGDEDIDSISSPIRTKIVTRGAIKYYVSRSETLGPHVTRLDLTSTVDPFARDSIAYLDDLTRQIQQLLPEGLQGASLSVMGATASIRDLKAVTDRDQIRIDLLVVMGVYAILVLLLRRPALCLYLILTVLFSYLVTLGVTYGFYWYWDGADFAGLDWKVPMFLFTILIAVGEDYNIFLMTRIAEEQVEFGPVKGVTHALARTGRIISSCGIIMAGTFASLMAGSLKGMSQLGFALAFGVLLDTFVVRPILVPAYLVVLHSGRFGRIGKWLGSTAMPLTAHPDHDSSASHATLTRHASEGDEVSSPLGEPSSQTHRD